MFDDVFDSLYQEAARQPHKEERMFWKKFKRRYRAWRQMMDYCINASQGAAFIEGKWVPPSALLFVDVILTRIWYCLVVRNICKIKGHDWEEDDQYIDGRGCGRVDVTCQRCFEHHGGYW